jgi:hypothetical protein
MATQTIAHIGPGISLAILAAALAGCGRGASQPPAPEAVEAARPAAVAPTDAGPAPSAAPGAEAERWRGIKGRVVVLEGTAGGEALVVLPNDRAPAKRAKVAADGGFEVPGLDPAVYRVVLPADGVHATAELYVTVDQESGRAETTIHRSRGCPVKIAVRDQAGAPVRDAELELALTDLEVVAEPGTVRGATDDEGRLVLVGSCVRGFLKGTLRVAGRGAFAIDHGYVGSGWDRFDVIVPDQADAGVTYANDG